MEVTYSHCAGLDVHKKIVVACCLWPTESGNSEKETRSFGTTTEELLSLSSWLSSLRITHIAMESTEEYWKPIYNILESSFEVMVVNAQHIKNVLGRKTDVKDAEWIMLKAIVDGENDVQVLASYAKGRLSKKRLQLEKALQGEVRDHHRFLI